jgi:transposase InsO family protein
MARKRFSPERIITMLGEAEVLLNQSNPVAEVCRKLGGIRADRLPLAQGVRRDELLNGEVLDTPDEAKVLVEAGRKAYNRIRPHSSLGYRPPWSENSL